MGSTGEADKKRRHFSSISPTSALKKQPLAPLSEEKKLDAAVLQFQNQKLLQKLETQKVEINALEDKFYQLKDKQQSYEKTLSVVNNSWEELVDDLESRSMNFVKHRRDSEGHLVKDGESHPEDALLIRLLETGATESSSTSTIASPIEEGRKIDGANILQNILVSFDDLNGLKDRLYASSLKALSSSGQSQRVVISSDLQTEIKNLRIAVLKLHLKHRELARELQIHRDGDAKNKADLRRLKGELGSTITELEESNRILSVLKSERDVAKSAFFPILTRGNDHVISDKPRDNQRELQEMESTLKEILEQSTSRLQELKRLHEDRLNTLKRLSDLQGNLKNVNCICSSKAYCLLKDQLTKAKSDVVQYQALYEKIQVEKESLYMREKTSHIKNEFIDVHHLSSTFADSRRSDLEVEIHRYLKEKDLIEAKLEEASKEPGRKAIIVEFKNLVASFPDKIGSMRSQLSKHKETAADVHSLRAHVQSLATVLGRQATELEAVVSRSDQKKAEIQKLKDVIRDLKATEADMELFMEMYGHQSIHSREISEARYSEIKAWAHVQGLNSSLDERNLELRVKVSIEAEAEAQQRLAASEAEIAELRQKLEASKREKTSLPDFLKSKQEETEAYLSEIETIGQAYDDMQTQNQQILQQITERDDYNLVLESVRARQLRDTLLMKKCMLEKTAQQTKKIVDFYDLKAGKIEDQLKSYSDHLRRHSDDKAHNTASRETTKRRLSDVRKSSQQVRGTLGKAQSEVDRRREQLIGLQLQLEKERFARKRVEEDIDNQRRKAEQLKWFAEGPTSVAGKLQQELREYNEILKCSVCLDRRKEVVITKCYHLLCNPCVQRVIETRHRKCPVCAASFGANDVKPIYI